MTDIWQEWVAIRHEYVDNEDKQLLLLSRMERLVEWGYSRIATLEAQAALDARVRTAVVALNNEDWFHLLTHLQGHTRLIELLAGLSADALAARDTGVCANA
jgi:hypothetical protein